MGFRSNSSTIYNIFVLRQIYLKFHEYNFDLHNIFIDFPQAFDTVHRVAIYSSLIKYNVPHKLINLIKLTTQRNKMKMKVNNSYSGWFEKKTAVRQRDPLSAILFSVLLDWVNTKLEVQGNITATLKQICAYADDIIILGRTTQNLIDTFRKLKHEAINIGIIENNNKTKYQFLPQKQSTLPT